MTGEELGPLFVLPHDPRYLWIVALLAAAPAIGIALFGLVRGRLPAVAGAAGVLIPVFAYVLGHLFVLEESKSVAFCGSCHETMGPVAASLGQDNGSLASIHWRRGRVPHADACYKCHSGYGIWGSVRAKRAGISHMVHTLTGSYEFPLQARSFDVHSCLGCHAEAVPFRSVEVHRDPDLQRQLLSGELGCAGLCHPPAHPEEALRGSGAVALGSAR
jgi:hypothetical protein